MTVQKLTQNGSLDGIIPRINPHEVPEHITVSEFRERMLIKLNQAYKGNITSFSMQEGAKLNDMIKSLEEADKRCWESFRHTGKREGFQNLFCILCTQSPEKIAKLPKIGDRLESIWNADLNEGLARDQNRPFQIS